MPMHPAENRGYRELYLTGRQLVGRWTRLADAIGDPDASAALSKGAESVSTMLAELAPLTARHDLHGDVAAQGTGRRLGVARAVVGDRFLERNQALRFALDDLEHVATLLAYLATVSEKRGDANLPEFCRGWERRLRRQLGAVRKTAVAMGRDPDAAIEPIDPSAVGKAAHGAAYAAGTVGEWFDRQVARRRGG